MEKGFDVKDSFLTGSYSRSTMIAPLKQADVDIFIVLDPKYFYHYDNGQNGGQAGLLDLVKRTLRRTYPDTPDISRSGQAVSIRFSDFVVDVVPGFVCQDGGFLIPNSVSSNWIQTDPKAHVTIMAESNRAHEGDLVPLVKMIKCWNRNSGSFFRSFHLEVMALGALEGIKISDFDSGVRFFFDHGRKLVATTNLDPAGYGDDVGSYINTQQKINDAVTKFQLAYDRAIKAEGLAIRGSTAEAIQVWTMIFGQYFPAYG